MLTGPCEFARRGEEDIQLFKEFKAPFTLGLGVIDVKGGIQTTMIITVEVDGRRLSCLVRGSFQPFLEALRGSEVINLTSIPTPDGGG